jgi:hypothetical protein
LAVDAREVASAFDGEAVRRACRSTLDGNWREGVRRADGVSFAYTSPSPAHYPFQWYWDSCFAAIVWRRFDPSRARRELESLLAAARPDGFIGHTIFWDTPLNARQRLTYNVTSRSAPMTATIQPPLLAWAWRIAVGDPTSELAIVAHHEWLCEHRDLDGDGLIWIVQPDESGLDSSPQFDGIWGPSRTGPLQFVRLVRRNRQLGFDLRQILVDGGPVCCEVMTNVLHSLSALALGRPSLTAAIVERLYDERAGLFRPLARPRAPRRHAVTWAALAPLALPDLPQEIGRRLVEEHLLDPRKFWLALPPPSVAADDPAFSTRDTLFGIRRYWRGPTWVNAAWLIWLGLVRLGYTAEAELLGARLGAAVAAAGLREYYDPFSGRGMGAHAFAWSTLALELLDPDPQAATSHIPSPEGRP